MDPGLGLEVLLIAVVDQGVEAIDGLDPDIAATAAVATVGPPYSMYFLASERDRAAAAVAGADIDLALVQKFHLRLLSQGACHVEPKCRPTDSHKLRKNAVRVCDEMLKHVVRQRVLQRNRRF
jgi:hypothetical protein